MIFDIVGAEVIVISVSLQKLRVVFDDNAFVTNLVLFVFRIAAWR